MSGQKLDAYLRDNLLAPLGMNDTAFKISDAMRQRVVGMHARGEDGVLAPMPFELEQTPEFHMGGGGLYGTAGDYIKFTQMILNKGRGNGNQVLKAETVALIRSSGKSVAQVSREMDLIETAVRRWLGQPEFYEGR